MKHSIERLPDLSSLRAACADCSLYQLCLPIGLSDSELAALDDIIRRRPPLRRGEHLFQVGDALHALYAVRAGSVKTYIPTEDGQEQVMGFHLPGELLGLDAISTERHPCAAHTLETTSICEVPYARLEEISSRVPNLHRQLLRLMSKELSNDQALLLLLGKKSADERLAAYLLSLSLRYNQRGFSATEFNLSMSRHDIGNYLGLAVETVSRLFTRFQEEQLLEVQRKHVRLLNVLRLRAMAGLD
jgi:CRP/FNR family transcriptional regulator